jgi:integration host factor subunit beta
MPDFWILYLPVDSLLLCAILILVLNNCRFRLSNSPDRGGKMNKSELIEALAKEKELTYKRAEEIVNTIFSSLSKTLIDGGRIEIRGFGSFVVKDYKSYQGRNPKTGESIHVEPKKLPFFKVGKELRDRVNGDDIQMR